MKIQKKNTNLADCTWKYLRPPWMLMILPLSYNFELDLTQDNGKMLDWGSVPPLLHLQNQSMNEICSRMKKISYVRHLKKEIQCTKWQLKNSMKMKRFDRKKMKDTLTIASNQYVTLQKIITTTIEKYLFACKIHWNV